MLKYFLTTWHKWVISVIWQVLVTSFSSTSEYQVSEAVWYLEINYSEWMDKEHCRYQHTAKTRKEIPACWKLVIFFRIREVLWYQTSYFGLFVTPVLMQISGFGFNMWLSSSAAVGGKAGSTNQAAREARPGGHRPWPAGCPRVAQRPPHERDHCELTVMSPVCVLVRSPALPWDSETWSRNSSSSNRRNRHQKHSAQWFIIL